MPALQKWQTTALVMRGRSNQCARNVLARAALLTHKYAVPPEGAAMTIINCDMGEGFGLYKMGDDADIKNKNWPKVTFGKARALTIRELDVVAQGFADGAARVVEAGFDGVEIHGANGYPLWQFINPKTNLREDEFGGSPENNVRFARMVCDRVRKAIGKNKIISLRVSQDGVDDFVGAWPGGVNYAHAIGTRCRAHRLTPFTGQASAGAKIVTPRTKPPCQKSSARPQAFR
jgi:NADH:flavin oxidoreductase / NADH oxidase family